MFGTLPVIRFSQFAAVLLTVGLVAFSGCRTLSPRPSATPPVQPHVFQQPNIVDASDQYSAFRPIMPEIFTPPTLTPPIFTPPMIVQEPPSIAPPSIEFPSIDPPGIESHPEIIIAQSAEQSTAQQSTIDELHQRIEELETQLAEAQEAVRREPPPVNLLESPFIESLPADVTPVETTPVRAARLPIINREGVSVYADESQYARIEIADRFLFMPNAWQLTAEGEETLRVVAAELRAFDSQSVLDIEGHTDSLMGDPNNPMQKHEISSIKTKVVMDFFVNALRWDAARIGISSFGRSRPIADNGTPEGRARNNRIEIVIRNGRE